MSGDSSVVIACAVDGAYALPLAVTLRSAMENLDPTTTAEIYVVDDGLSAEDRHRIESSLPSRAHLNWLQRSVSELEDLPRWGRMSLTTYRKLAIGEWLPAHVHRVIWLDADLLVCHDLLQLWNADLGGNIALAAQDRGVDYLSGRFGVTSYRELGLPRNAKYFNAGVLLIDLERWRREDVMKSALDYLRRYRSEVFFWEQEALNVALAGRCGELDRRWNRIPRLDRLLNLRDSDTAETWIFHYAGNLKPWIYRETGREHDRYFEVVDLTAWRGWRPEEKWRTRLLGRYQSSRLRKMLYPLERMHLRFVRWSTRR